MDVRSQVTNIKQKGAEVVVCACLPGTDAQAIKGADQMGWHPQFMIDYVASDPTHVPVRLARRSWRES